MNHARLKKKTRIAHHGHSFPQQAFPVAYDKRFQVPPCSTAHRNEMTMLRGTVNTEKKNGLPNQCFLNQSLLQERFLL